MLGQLKGVPAVCLGSPYRPKATGCATHRFDIWKRTQCREPSVIYFEVLATSR